VVVFGQFLEPGVLDNLEKPETDRERGENSHNQKLQDRESVSGPPPLFVLSQFPS
jgi:hypothetical protein